jgi:hypothetical protein
LAERKNMNTVQQFGNVAQRLARKPLGIIALFIVLVYGIAGLVFGTSIQHIQPAQQWPLIIFLVVFPVLVLIAFLWLLEKHHKKLYAPGDFRNDEAFLQALGEEKQRKRLREEAESVASAQSPDADAERQTNVAEIPSRIPQEIFLAETLVFRELELRYGAPVRREVLWVHRGDRHGFDGAIVKDGRIEVAVDVKYVRRSMPDHVARRTIQRIAQVSRQAPFKTVLALVIDEVPRKNYEIEMERIRKMAGEVSSAGGGELGMDWELMSFGFSDLRRKYGLEKAANNPPEDTSLRADPQR